MNRNIEARFYDGEFDTEYAEFIMEHCTVDRLICNGDTLLDAMESYYLANEFLDYIENVE